MKYMMCYNLRFVFYAAIDFHSTPKNSSLAFVIGPYFSYFVQ